MATFFTFKTLPGFCHPKIRNLRQKFQFYGEIRFYESFLIGTLILSLELIWADESILAKWDKEAKNEDIRDGMSPDFEPKSSLSFNIWAIHGLVIASRANLGWAWALQIELMKPYIDPLSMKNLGLCSEFKLSLDLWAWPKPEIKLVEPLLMKDQLGSSLRP